MATTPVAPPTYATVAEVRAAVEALTDADLLRLEKVAAFRANSLLGLGLGISGDDLLQEAIARSITEGDGQRRWRKGISLVKHLMAVMRNLTSNARDALSNYRIGALASDDEDGSSTATDTSHEPTPEVAAAIRQQLAAIGERFVDDDRVGLVIEGLATGMTGPQIQEDLGITQREFETAMKRLRRGVDRESGWRP